MPWSSAGDRVEKARAQWIADGMEFEEIIVDRNNVVVSLSWDCAEGNEGDFDPEDPEDEPRLRFDVSQRDASGNLEAVDDASCCTQLKAYANRSLLTDAAEAIWQAVSDRVNDGYSIKRLCEQISWIHMEGNKVIF